MSNSNHNGMWARSLDRRVAGRQACPADGAPVSRVHRDDCAHARPGHWRERGDLRGHQQPAPASAARGRPASARDDLLRRRHRPRTGRGPLELCDVGTTSAARVALRRRFRVDARTVRPGAARRAAARGRDLRQRRVLRDARRRGDSRPHVHASGRSTRRRGGRRGRDHQLRTLATALRRG